MSTLNVTHPTGEYPVHIWRNALADTGRLLNDLGLSGKAAIITNETIGDQYEASVLSSMNQAGFDPIVCHVRDGEIYKTLATVSALYDQLIEHGLDRVI